MATGKLIAKADHTLVFEASPGSYIGNVAKEVCAIVADVKASVSFDFNGIACLVKPGCTAADVEADWRRDCDAAAEAYRNSPEGKQRAKERAEAVKAKQDRIDRKLLPMLPRVVGNLDKLVRWIAQASDVMDDTDVKVDYPAIVAAFEAAGWKDGAHVGRKPSSFTKQMLGEYLVGQAIDCMKRGMCPHPVSQKFAQEYAEK